MAAAALLVAAALLGHVKAGVVELNCSDNATCIENMAKEFVRSIRQQKTIRVFDALTVEPLRTGRQARSNAPLSSFLESHAFSFDWNDYTFKLWKAQDRNDVLDLEIFQGRSTKEVPEEVPKKSKTKVEEEPEAVIDDKKTPKRRGIIRRRSKKKLLQAVIPLVFGMKSAAAVILALAVVTVLVMKAFVASKLALIVSVGMAVKRLYESYSLGAGLQNHPYLYSQYPIDFPSASSHAYSVSGVSPQFQEMYNPSGLAAHQQSDLLQQDASAQQSQQAPSVQLLNSTRASERWDGKSLLQKLIEPILEGVKSYMDPITNLFYSMPATFRGLNSDVTTMKTLDIDNEIVEPVKKPREILVAQPRHRAQRKMTYRAKGIVTRPKKYTELKVDLEKLKKNKDFHDYVKTKKYKYNYQNTFYYPRVKHFVNPNTYVTVPKNTRLIPYRKDIATNITQSVSVNSTKRFVTQWKPIVLVPVINFTVPQVNITSFPSGPNFTTFQRNVRRRAKRSLGFENKNPPQIFYPFQFSISGRGFMKFLETLADADPVSAMMKQATKYTKSVMKNSLKATYPPKYYTIAYELVMMSLDIIDGLVQVHEALIDYLDEPHHSKRKKIKASLSEADLDAQEKPAKPVSNKQKQKRKRKKKPSHQAGDEAGDLFDEVESHKDTYNEKLKDLNKINSYELNEENEIKDEDNISTTTIEVKTETTKQEENTTNDSEERTTEQSTTSNQDEANKDNQQEIELKINTNERKTEQK